LNSISLAEILNEILFDASITVGVTNSNRLVFECEFNIEINDMSYNMLQITGFFGSQFPITSELVDNISSTITAPSIGFYLSTPILYLLSNIGSRCFKHKHRTTSDNKVVMVIVNSFSANLPIISNNAEYSTMIPSNSLSDVWFQLVDANMQPIKLLSPLYITGIGIGYENDVVLNPYPDNNE
jgi:hypothetical protein